MTPQQVLALLALIAELYSQITELQRENNDLKGELQTARINLSMAQAAAEPA